MTDSVSSQHPIIEHKGQRFRVLKKDKFLGPYGWNVSKLIDVGTNDVIWDFRSDDRGRLDQVLREGAFVQESQERAGPAERKGEAKTNHAQDGNGSGANTWSIKVHEGGLLERDGSVSDRVAWAIEHEGRRVACKNAHACMTYKYSSSVEFTAFLVDMETYSRCVSNQVTFLPPSTSCGNLEASPSCLDRSVDRSDFHIVPKELPAAHGTNGETSEAASSIPIPTCCFPTTFPEMVKEGIIDRVLAGELMNVDARTSRKSESFDQGYRVMAEELASSIKKVFTNCAARCTISAQSQLVAEAVIDETTKVFDVLLKQVVFPSKALYDMVGNTSFCQIEETSQRSSQVEA
eukprot:766190-Hanusia_phi.AAC.5